MNKQELLDILVNQGISNPDASSYIGHNFLYWSLGIFLVCLAGTVALSVKNLLDEWKNLSSALFFISIFSLAASVSAVLEPNLRAAQNKESNFAAWAALPKDSKFSLTESKSAVIVIAEPKNENEIVIFKK